LAKVEKIPRVNAYIVDNPPATMKRGVLGLGLLSEFYKYVRNGFVTMAGDFSMPVMISYRSLITKVHVAANTEDLTESYV
jgi:hypothetical protein